MLSLVDHFLCSVMQRVRLEELVYRDELTGLFNYRFFQVALAAEIRRASRTQKSFGLMFLDLDNFKDINDQYGHSVGSLLLQKIAQILKLELRLSDIIVRWRPGKNEKSLGGNRCFGNRHYRQFSGEIKPRIPLHISAS